LATQQSLVNKRITSQMLITRKSNAGRMFRFRGCNHSTCKTVLNLLEAVNFRFRKIVVEKVTVVKFRVDNRGIDGRLVAVLESR